MEAKDTVMRAEEILGHLSDKHIALAPDGEILKWLEWIALAQAKLTREETAREILEWGLEPCYEHSSGGVFTRRECPKCWQALKSKYPGGGK